MAGGLSLDQSIADAVKATGIYTIVINNSWLLMPDADALFAADAGWWFSVPKVSPTKEQFKGQWLISQDMRMRIPEAVFVKPRQIINGGGNSALRAAHWAQDQGAKKLLLFGVDLRDDELTHHHGLHVGMNNPHKGTFRLHRTAWEMFSRELNGLKVINCNPRSAVECFPKMTLEEALVY